jgi:DNA-binding PadR family transcriptional regulator
MAPKEKDPSTILPLSAPALRILVTLGSRELHGYGIMQELKERTGGRETLLPGTLYSSMARMVDQGLVEEADDTEASASGGPRRRYYRTTQLGRRVARSEMERMETLMEVARATHLIPGARG